MRARRQTWSRLLDLLILLHCHNFKFQSCGFSRGFSRHLRLNTPLHRQKFRKKGKTKKAESRCVYKEGSSCQCSLPSSHFIFSKSVRTSQVAIAPPFQLCSPVSSTQATACGAELSIRVQKPCAAGNPKTRTQEHWRAHKKIHAKSPIKVFAWGLSWQLPAPYIIRRQRVYISPLVRLPRPEEVIEHHSSLTTLAS